MHMIINNIAYREGHRVGPVTIEEISEVLKEPDTFIWLGTKDPDNKLLLKIQEEFGLHDLAIEDARKAHQRTKIEEYGHTLFVAIKTAQLVDDHIEIGETHLFVGEKFMVSVRHGASVSHSGVRARCEHNPKMLRKGPGFALYALLDFVVDNFQPIVSRFEREFDELEADLFNSSHDASTITRFYELKRKLMTFRTMILPINDVCAECMRFHDYVVPKELKAYFRDIQDHVARLIGTIDTLREMLATAMQVNLALVGVRQNEVVKSLAGWGAILAIPTVMFSWYGMNFRNMPELDIPWGYPLLLCGTLAGCFLLHRKLKQSGWV